MSLVNHLVDRDAPPTPSRAGTTRLWPDGVLTVMAMAAVATAHLVGRPGDTLLDVVATGFLVPLVLIDLRVRRLPDRLTLGGTAAAVALLAARAVAGGDFGPLGRGLLGASVMASLLLTLHLVNPSGMGFGDVKLGLLLGVVVGSRALHLVVTALFVAGLAGALVGLILVIRHRRRHVALPFGPCLVLGGVLALVLGGA
jgi:leader peptidase (prepilin peptidase)/N-methyltransferase